MWKAYCDSMLPAVAELSESYGKAEPFPHIVVDNFLPEHFARELLRDFPTFLHDRACDEFGKKSLKFTNENVGEISPAYRELEALLSSRHFLDWLSKVTGISNLMFDPTHLGGGTHENLAGQELSPHVDFNIHPRFGWFRRVNLLIYLNPEWHESWGGNLDLHLDPWRPRAEDKVVSIPPSWNRLAIFTTSDVSWHGFELIKKQHQDLNFSRKSFAAYFYTKEPPPHGLSFYHSTIYCERPIPESVQPGRILAAADYQEILRLTSRRDQLLQLLYEREKGFSELSLSMIEEKKNLELVLKSGRNKLRNARKLAIAYRKDHRNLLAAFQRKVSAMESDHAGLLQAMAEKEVSWEAETAAAERARASLFLELTEKSDIWAKEKLAAERDHADLLLAFRKKVGFLEDLLHAEYRPAAEKALTFLSSGNGQFTVANGSCNLLKLWSGCGVKIESYDPRARGALVLIPLSCVLPSRAEAGQFTLVQQVRPFGGKLLVRTIGARKKFVLVSNNQVVGRVTRKVDWFGEESVVSLPLETSFWRRKSEKASAYFFAYFFYLKNVLSAIRQISR